MSGLLCAGALFRIGAKYRSCARLSTVFVLVTIATALFLSAPSKAFEPHRWQRDYLRNKAGVVVLIAVMLRASLCGADRPWMRALTL